MADERSIRAPGPATPHSPPVPPSSLADLALLARRAPAPKGHTKTRTVVRFDPGDVDRLDALGAKLGGTSRAALVRAFVLVGLSTVGSLPSGAAEGGGTL